MEKNGKENGKYYSGIGPLSLNPISLKPYAHKGVI